MILCRVRLDPFRSVPLFSPNGNPCHSGRVTTKPPPHFLFALPRTMSRGIGAIQRTILDHVRQSGVWRWVVEVIREIWIQEGHAGEPSRSFQVSVWRAITTLTKRGLVRTTSHLQQRGCLQYGMRGMGLAVWLPEQASPEWVGRGDAVSGSPVQRLRIDGSVYDDLVLTALQASPQGLPYPQLWQRVRRKARSDDARHRVALRRSLDRLERTGMIGTRRRERHRGDCIVEVWPLAPALSVSQPVNT